MKSIQIAIALFVAIALLTLVPVHAETAHTYTWFVDDPDGNPISGATINMSYGTTDIQGTTDTHGQFQFELFPSDFPVTMSIVATGYNNTGALVFSSSSTYSTMVTMTATNANNNDTSHITGSKAPLCGGTIMACAIMLCGCLIVSKRTR